MTADACFSIPGRIRNRAAESIMNMKVLFCLSEVVGWRKPWTSPIHALWEG